VPLIGAHDWPPFAERSTLLPCVRNSTLPEPVTVNGAVPTTWAWGSQVMPPSAEYWWATVIPCSQNRWISGPVATLTRFVGAFVSTGRPPSSAMGLWFQV
jgi:hypothetical protein